MTFKRKAFDRQLTFEEIAEETGLTIDHVELMVMKALSLGLLKGTIDQIDQKVNITWVQPRVLDKKQVRLAQIWSTNRIQPHIPHHHSTDKIPPICA